MGKLDLSHFRFLSHEELRILDAVEHLMRSHEVVDRGVIALRCSLFNGGIHKILKELCMKKLLRYERGRKYNGYCLTNLGYDYLALKELVRRKVIEKFGHQIGVGKESNIYNVQNHDSEEHLCLKLHRLGRTCFRSVKNKRDYIPNSGKNKSSNWLYLSKLSALKEYNYMKALYGYGFPIPQPIDMDRHCVVMKYIAGSPLKYVKGLQKRSVEDLYDDLMNIIVKFAEYGCIHGDFNEFNVILTEEETPVIIDFPQMVSTSHVNAKLLFERDVEGVRNYFLKTFNFEADYPTFEYAQSLPKIKRLDREIYCPGFPRKDALLLEKAINIDGGLGGSSETDESDNSSDEEVSDVEENDSCVEYEDLVDACAETATNEVDFNTSCNQDEEEGNKEEGDEEEVDEKEYKQENYEESEVKSEYKDEDDKAETNEPAENILTNDSKLMEEEIAHGDQGVDCSESEKKSDCLHEELENLNIANDKSGEDNFDKRSIITEMSRIEDLLREKRTRDIQRRLREQSTKKCKQAMQKKAAKNARSNAVYQGRKEIKAVARECRDAKTWF